MNKLKVLSLFSGIGAFEKALTNLGVSYELVGFSEIDKYAIKSFCAIHNIDESLNVGDISKVDKSKLPDFDLLVGGSPCQAFSIAGQRKGFEDTRGTLFFEYVDTLKHKQPKFFVFENVKGLINHDKGRTLNIIAQSFSEIGYRIDMELLNSKYFDVPQNRERIYIVGIREDLIKHQEWEIPKERKDAMAKGKRRLKELGIKMFNFDFPKQEKVSRTIRDILEDNVDEKYYLSEDKTKKLIEKLKLEQQYKNDTIFNGKNSFCKIKIYDEITPTILSNDYKESKKIVEEIDLKMVGKINIKGNNSIRRVYSTDRITPTLTTMEGGHREPKIVVETQVNYVAHSNGIAYCIDANYAKGISPNSIEKGKRTHIIEEVRPVLTPERENKRQNGRRFKNNNEEAFTVTAQDRHGVAIGIFPNYRIRKLTPLECWRLQAFSDDDFNKAKAAGISDSQLYKQAGNSITVTVLEEIFKNLLHIYIK